MYSSEDLERFYFQYQTDALPHGESNDGDVFIVMSKDRRTVCMFTYDNRSYSLFEKKFVSGYQFMKHSPKEGIAGAGNVLAPTNKL